MEVLIELNKNKEEMPSIIFLDLSMPIMSGWEFLEAFPDTTISNKENLRIIVMSSSIDPSDLEKIAAL